ncbi:MAG: hypothetical protein ACXWIN_07380, partial [Burkholderiaceae bacterium]
RQLLTFLASSRKVSKRRRPRRRCPSGSHESNAPVGKRNQLAALRHVSLLYPTDTLLSWQRLKRNFQKQKHLNATAALRRFFVFWFGFLILILSLMLTLNPWRSAARKWIQVDQKRNMSERSELVSLPT